MKRLVTAALCALSFAANALPTPGIYWNPQEPGTGYAIEVQQNLLAVAIYTYRENGDPVWYLAAGQMFDGNQRFSAPAVEFLNGQCPGCPYQAPEVIDTAGTVELEFQSRTTALLTWAGRTIPIERQNFGFASGPGSMLGRWLLTSATSRGFTDTVDYEFRLLAPPSGAEGGTGMFIAPDQRAAGECFSSGDLAGFCLVIEVDNAGTIRRAYIFDQELDQAIGARVNLNTGDTVEMVGYQLLPNTLLARSARARSITPNSNLVNAIRDAADIVERPE